MSLDGLRFEWPWVFLCLPVLWAIWVWSIKKNQHSNQENDAIFMPFWFSYYAASASLKKTTFQPLVHLERFVLFLLSILLFTTLSNPYLALEQTYVPQKSRYIILSVDFSKSMSLSDVFWQNKRLTRLDAAKIALSEFIKNLKNDRLGLVLFGDQAYLVAPPTLDHNTLADHLIRSKIGVAGQNTAIGDAIGLSIKHLKDLPEDSKTIILLTDGSNTAGVLDPLRATKIAKELNIKIYTIGLGGGGFSFFGNSTQRSYDPELLEQMANETNGQFFEANGVDSLRKIYNHINRLEAVEIEQENYRIVHYLYYYPLAGLLLCLLVWLLVRVRRG